MLVNKRLTGLKITSKKQAKDLGLKRYFTGKECKHGHVSERLVSTRQCCECLSERRKTDRARDFSKKYREKNKEKMREYMADYYRRDIEKSKSSRSEYYQQNKDKIKNKVSDYRIKNIEKVKENQSRYRKRNKDKINKYRRDWYKNKNNKASVLMRKLVRRVTGRCGGLKSAEDRCGYKREDLISRIECQFKRGMSWDNYGDWHIDHKKPVSRFVSQGVTDPRIVNSLANLQPMWAKDNLSKSNKFIMKD